MAAVAIGGESTVSIATFQFSRFAVSKISRRSRSSASFTVVSAMISCSWSAATSACADTRSSGGDVPTSTLALLTRTSSWARSSVDRRASTVARADTRFQYADFTFAVVWTRLSRSRVSEMSRLVRLVASCWRLLSMDRFRMSGCDTATDSPDCSSGL